MDNGEAHKQRTRPPAAQEERDPLYVEPLLSADEEYALFTEYRGTRDPAIRERLILANMRLVRVYASRYAAHTELGSLTEADMRQEGTIGLMRAIEKFNPARGYKFSTYATSWIRQAMMRARMDQAEMIREPVHVQDQRGAANKRGEDGSHLPGLPARALVLSLDAPTNGNPANDPLGHYISDETMPPMEDSAVERVTHHQTLYVALGRLSTRERYVIELRFGLSNSGDPMTLEEVGAGMNITRERVRQIEAKALIHLRLALRQTAEGDVALRGCLALVAPQDAAQAPVRASAPPRITTTTTNAPKKPKKPTKKLTGKTLGRPRQEHPSDEALRQRDRRERQRTSERLAS